MQFDKRIGYLHVSLLSACNLNCFYCRPPQALAPSIDSPGKLDQFQSAIEILYGMGVRKVRFTGGEPTLYKHLAKIIRFTRDLDSEMKIAITTNGMLLPKLAPLLADAGLDSANISLDTINNEKFSEITRRDRFDQVMSGIESAVAHIPEVKLNCVLIRGVNDSEVADLIRFADRLAIDIRFIEFMPTKTGSSSKERFISGDEIRSRLPFTLTKLDSDPSAAARYYGSPELGIRVGFINPVSHSFCADCNRLRLVSDGTLYGCLFSRDAINLFSLVSRTGSAEEAIRELVDNKQYIGCPSSVGDTDNLPSFVAMGG